MDGGGGMRDDNISDTSVQGSLNIKKTIIFLRER